MRNDTRCSEAQSLSFDPGLGVVPVIEPLGFHYSPGAFGPTPELRALSAIRPSLQDPSCSGPDPVYAIVMDIGCGDVRVALERKMLLFGAVVYAAGTLGREPVRSQGHVHHVSLHSGWSPPEVYEIWRGAAYVYMQEHVADDPGRCYAILANPGDIVVVPPAWAHAAISANPAEAMALGALCDREYSFDYDAIRQRRGLAWYPVVAAHGNIDWIPNPRYGPSDLKVRPPRDYPDLGFIRGKSLYEQALQDLDRFSWVSKPNLVNHVWTHFEP